MTKLEFILALNEKLSGFPRQEVLERINFYGEMIEDRMEEGLSEEDAVAAVGPVEEIANQIAVELGGLKVVPPKQRPVGQIVLLVLGVPLWLPLLVAAFAVAFSLYISLWAVIVSLWAVLAALVGSAVGTLAVGTGFLLGGNGLPGAAMLAAAMVLAGLSLFAFMGCKAATEGVVIMSKKLVSRVLRRLGNG